jgi:hypothetical protein
MQTTQEKITISKYWFEKLAPKYFLNTEHNAYEIANYLHEQSLDTTFSSLTAAVAALGDINNGGRLQFNPKPQVIEKIVYKVPEKTVEDIARENREKFEQAHALGLLPKRNRTELDRGDADKPPVLTEIEKAKLNAYNENQNQIIADTLHKIATFQGRIHSRTFSGRAELKKVFEDGMNRRLKAEQIEKLVDAKLEKLAQ